MFFFFQKQQPFSPCFREGHIYNGTTGGAVGRGTALHVGKSRVRFPIMSLEFFISHNTSCRTVAPGVDSASITNQYQGYFLRDKSGRCVVLTNYHLHVPIVF